MDPAIVASVLSELNRSDCRESTPISRIAMADTETTGTDPSRDRIVQIAIITCDLGLNEMRRGQSYVNPGEAAIAEGHVAKESLPPWALKPCSGKRLSDLDAALGSADSEGLSKLREHGLPWHIGGVSMGEASDILSVLGGGKPADRSAVSAYDIHGIEDEVLLAAPAWGETAKWVAEELKGSVLIAHEVEFDYGFIAEEMARSNMTGWDPAGVVCSKDIAEKAGVPLDMSRMSILTEAFGEANDNEHDAMADTEAMAAVLRHLFGVLSGKRRLPDELRG